MIVNLAKFSYVEFFQEEETSKCIAAKSLEKKLSKKLFPTRKFDVQSQVLTKRKSIVYLNNKTSHFSMFLQNNFCFFFYYIYILI